MKYFFKNVMYVLTAPGVILHEMGHEFFCHLNGVRVCKVCYFRLGNPAGYVVHDRPKYFVQAFLIAAGPFVFGSGLTLLAFALSQRAQTPGLRIALVWVGLAIAVHALPSHGDAKTLWVENWEHIKHNPLAILEIPLSLLIWILSSMNSLWSGIFYAGFLFWVSSLMGK